MPTNTSVTSALQAGTVPPDRNCPQNGQDVANLVQDFVTVVSTSSSSGGGTDNSIAQQALETANIAISIAQAAQAAIPQTRTNGAPFAIPMGDSPFPISWAPPMPDTNYEVRGTFFGTATFPAAYFAFFVEDGTRTVNGCVLRLNNIPANFKFAYVVQSLPSL